jgi:7-keto-8-aminopelargonate synthetase-like enzyme
MQDIHKQLEKTIAEFHGTEDAILYTSCFDANAGIFEALLGPLSLLNPYLCLFESINYD